MNPQDFVRKFALRLKLHKVGGGAVHHVALLIKALDVQGIKCKMVKGYCVVPETKESCDHYWAQTDEGLDLDVAFEVARLRSPDMGNIHPVLLDTVPEGFQKTDKDEILIRDDNERLFELYNSNPKLFWSECPVKNFKLT